VYRTIRNLLSVTDPLSHVTSYASLCPCQLGGLDFFTGGLPLPSFDPGDLDSRLAAQVDRRVVHSHRLQLRPELDLISREAACGCGKRAPG
jgi:hypothetical protein